MKKELLTIIEYMEKDRGLDRTLLIETIEQAIETASRKVDEMPPGIRVRISPDSGDLTASCDLEVVSDEEGEERVRVAADTDTEEEQTEEESSQQPWWPLSKVREFVPDAEPGDVVHIELDIEAFGRIPAQTAKQVIIQRLSELEREKVLTEYTHRVGELVNGTVSRYDRGTLIIDLGQTEAWLTKREQSPAERYRPGDRIRALVLDVKDTEESRVPRVLLSRASSALLRRLFELEVPEIYDGIVEVKAIAREAGYRSKVAVYSHDPKIDGVGSCVGVRGTRVKNIVQEINGEKIDIIRWSDDIEEFVKNCLHPVEIMHTLIDAETERILLIVPDEHLSTAIGKSGQNIRLTSKITGWKVDVIRQSEADRVAREQGVDLEEKNTFTRIFDPVDDGTESSSETGENSAAPSGAGIFHTVSSEVSETHEEEKDTQLPSVDDEAGITSLTDVPGISQRLADTLIENGITTVAQLRESDEEALCALPGFGPKTVEKIMTALRANSQ